MADLGSTPNLVTLSGFGDSRVIPGDEIYVVAEDADFVYRIPPPTFTADGVNSVKAVNIAGTWMRRSAGDSVVQTTWFIDPVNGNDANDGSTAGTALRTTAERRRRWGLLARIASGTNITVTYLSNVAAGDAESLMVQMEPGAGLTLLGTMVQSKTGTFTAVQTANVGAQQSWAVTDTVGGLGAADIGKIIRITGGARVGAYARILADLGGNQVRTTPFGTFAVSVTATVAFAVVTPLAADPYEVVTPTTLPFGTINIYGYSNAQPTAGPLDAVVFDSLLFDGNFIGCMDLEASCFFARSIIRNNRAIRSMGFVTVCGGGADGLRLVNCPFFNLDGVGAIIGGSFRAGCNVTFEQGCVFQNCNATIDGAAVLGDISFWDRATPDAALVISQFGTAITQSPSTIWGTNNAGHGVLVRSGGKLNYVTKPTTNAGLGAGREALIGGTDKQWGAVPFVEPANNAMIVVTA